MGWEWLNLAKLRQTSGQYPDIICAIFLVWLQFISFLSSFSK